MKTVEYRFDPDDKVYWISFHNEPVEGKCPFCLGDGNFLRRSDKTSVQCRECKGTGKMNAGYDTTYKVFTGVVNVLRIQIQKDRTEISYNVCNIENGWGHDLNDSELYDNITDATEKCQKLNNKSGAMGNRGTYGITGG
jgi:hypothetical protein